MSDLPAEATETAAKAMLRRDYAGARVWHRIKQEERSGYLYDAEAALEAAAPAIREQERERMVERVKSKRRPEEILYTPALQGHDQGITDAIRAITGPGSPEWEAKHPPTEYPVTEIEHLKAETPQTNQEVDDE